MYKHNHRQKTRRRRKVWLPVLVVLLIAAGFGGWRIRQLLQPKTEIKQAHAITTKIAYDDHLKHYSKPDFDIDLPADWQELPAPAGPYQTYNWQNIKSADATTLTIYEDTIPLNFAVNRVLVVEGRVDHLTLDGNASENCNTFTKGSSAPAGQVGVPAKWQGVDFLCDQANTQRDVIGTSSAEGINSVALRSQSNGRTHKFFFTYTSHSLNPDYGIFYNVLSSFRLK